MIAPLLIHGVDEMAITAALPLEAIGPVIL